MCYFPILFQISFEGLSSSICSQGLINRDRLELHRHNPTIAAFFDACGVFIAVESWFYLAGTIRIGDHDSCQYWMILLASHVILTITFTSKFLGL